MNDANKIYDKINSNIWKKNILEIFNEDDLLIMYKWKYKENSNTWEKEVVDYFKKFCKNNKIKICENFKYDILYDKNNYKKYLYTLSDNYLANNKDLCIAAYNVRNFEIISFNPNSIKKKIYSKACNIENENFQSFPVGIYDRENMDKNLIKHTRIRTSIPIREIILNNYLMCNKNIKNYIYFLQTFPEAEKQKKNNPLYVAICNKCKSSNIVTHTLNQNEHWNNLNNHLFCLCVSWNTLESPRLWESLYFGCIPIIIDYYEENDFVENHYNDLPILHIKNINDLFSEKYIQTKYKSIMSNIGNYNFDKLCISYWKNILI